MLAPTVRRRSFQPRRRFRSRGRQICRAHSCRQERPGPV